MKYPSLIEAEYASPEQIEEWFLGLPAFTTEWEEYVWIRISQRYYFEE